MTATERGVVDREHSVLAEVGIHWFSFSVFRVGTGHVLCTNAARVGGASTLAQIRYPRTRSGPAPLRRRCRRGAGPPPPPPGEEAGHRPRGSDDAARNHAP